MLDLRRRLAATRWPDREIVADQSQGVQLTTVQQLVSYWQNNYDWRKIEARLNALPQFVTEIDGVDIHFIHVRSRHENALPMIVTHGWPGSIIEQMKIIGPLTDPTAHGATAADAFDLVIPSLPGHGFSGKPTELGWDPQRVARAWIVLMKRLGYNRYVAQGGDWGNAVTEQMAVIAPPELLIFEPHQPEWFQSPGDFLSGGSVVAAMHITADINVRPNGLPGSGNLVYHSLKFAGAGRPVV
jgi:pimeloyl-ACP methyl ester carboxylesterase